MCHFILLFRKLLRISRFSIIELFQVKFLIIKALILKEVDESPLRYKPLYICISLSSPLLQITDNTRTRDRLSFSLTPTRMYIYPPTGFASNPVKEIARCDDWGMVSRERASCTRRQIVWAESVSRATQWSGTWQDPYNRFARGLPPRYNALHLSLIRAVRLCIFHPSPTSRLPPASTPALRTRRNVNCVAMATRGLAKGARSLKVSLSPFPSFPSTLRFDSLISSLMNHFSKGDQMRARTLASSWRRHIGGLRPN